MSKLPWQGPLFNVKGHLAERYARALKHARGLDCPLSEFSIDRMGWSPQLAAALGDDYLGAESIRHAIILSPDQAGASLLRRRFSYEAALLEQVYLEARATLLHLIDQEPALVELDNGLTFCRTAIDVLNIRTAAARIETPRETLGKSRRLMELAKGLGEQARLLDEGYIDQMLALVKDIGDPRRQVQPPEMRVMLGSLWAQVDGVVYVLRLPNGQQKGTLLVSTRIDGSLKGLQASAVELDSPQLVDRLIKAGFLQLGNIGMMIAKRLGELELDALLNAGEAAPADDATARRKQLAANSIAQAALPPLYWELDALNKRLAAGAAFEPRDMSAEAIWALAVPARDADVVGHLLARFVRYDYRLLTHHHAAIVRAEWDRYSPTKRRYLEAHYPYITQGIIQASDIAPAPALNGGAPAPA